MSPCAGEPKLDPVLPQAGKDSLCSGVSSCPMRTPRHPELSSPSPCQCGLQWPSTPPLQLPECTFLQGWRTRQPGHGKEECVMTVAGEGCQGQRPQAQSQDSM